MDTEDRYDLPDKTAEPAAFKARIQRFYGYWNRRLQESDFDEVSLFMNWGYLPGPADEAIVEPLFNTVNASSVRLIHELVGLVAVEGADILDVGCGRGGTIATLARYFRPASLTGLDLTPENIGFCRRMLGDSRAQFVEGDAEALPFPDARFGVVTNVESSHCYPDIGRFFHEVARVLKPNGRFLYTDIFDMRNYDSVIARLRASGLALESDRDITGNVLRAREAEGGDQVAVLQAGGDPTQEAADAQLLDFVVARPGSEMHAALMEGRYSYRILRARKRDGETAMIGAIGGRAARQRGILGRS